MGSLPLAPPPLPPHAQTSLPPELTDHILDFLWQSRPDLRSCALVCRRWVPTSQRHLFKSFTVRMNEEHLCLLLSVLKIHTQALNLRNWASGSHHLNAAFLCSLPSLHRLTELTLGPVPPRSNDMPCLPRLQKLSLQRTKFAAASHFAQLIALLPKLSDLELDGVTWGDALQGAYPEVTLREPLEHLSIRGFESKAGVLLWLKAGQEKAPRTRRLSLHIPNIVTPHVMPIFAAFLAGLNGVLQDLHLDVHPCSSLEENICLLKLQTLSSLRRFRIGHGIYFHAPTSTYRLFRPVLDLPPSLLSRSPELDEVVLDVDILPSFQICQCAECSSPLLKEFVDKMQQGKSPGPRVVFRVLCRDTEHASLIRFRNRLEQEAVKLGAGVSCQDESDQ